MAWTFGLEALLSGECGLKGAMGAVLAENGETLKGTAVLETTDATLNWVSSEEKGKRKAINQNDGETTLTFEVANPSLEIQAYYLGGEVKTGEGGKKSYSPPKNPKTMHKSFKIVTKEGLDIHIPYGNINAKALGGNIGTDGVLTMKIVVTAELPEDSTVDYISYHEKTA